MGFSRSLLFVSTVLVAATSAGGVPFSSAQSAPCAGLLSGFPDGDDESSPESAIASAWRSLVSTEFSEHSTRDTLKEWLEKVAEGGEPFPAAEDLPSAAFAEGLDELSRVTGALSDAGRIERALLLKFIARSAVGILEEHGIHRVQTEERRASRSAVKEPFRRIPLDEAPILAAPLLLADGRIVVVAGPQLVFLTRAGVELSRTLLPASVGTRVSFLPGGEVVAGNDEGQILWFDLAGRELARVQSPIRHIDRIHALRDGSILIESQDREPVCIVTRSGRGKRFSIEFVNVDLLGELSDGRLLFASEDGRLQLVSLTGLPRRRTIAVSFETSSLSAVPLKNGTVFVKSNRGDFVLLDGDGNLLHRESGGLAGLANPVELPDGGIVFGSLTDGAVFINADGTFRARTPMRNSVGVRTTVLSSGVVVMGGGGRHLEFFESSGHALGSLMIAPDAFSPFQGVRSQLLEVPTDSGSAVGFVGLLDGGILRVDLEAVSALFGFPDVFSRLEVK